MAAQPIPDGVLMDAQLLGDLDKRPRSLGDTVSQIRPKISEAQLAGTLGEAPVSGPVALAGAANPLHDFPR